MKIFRWDNILVEIATFLFIGGILNNTIEGNLDYWPGVILIIFAVVAYNYFTNSRERDAGFKFGSKITTALFLSKAEKQEGNFIIDLGKPVIENGEETIDPEVFNDWGVEADE